MIDHDLLDHIGPRVVHITARGNIPLIQELGLLPAADLARIAGVNPAAIVLRESRLALQTTFGTAKLNHQNPINHGGTDPDTAVEGHSRQSWAAALDKRVFFSTLKRTRDFANSIAQDVSTARLTLDTALLLKLFGSNVDLAPINTGYFLRRAAKRGDWIYVPAANGLASFRRNRKERGLIASLDTVKELSIAGAIGPDLLKQLDMHIE